MFDYERAVANARALVEATRQSGWALAELTHDVLAAGVPATQWAADVGISRVHADCLARTWRKYADRKGGRRSFSEWYLLASTSRERAAQLERLSEETGLAVTTLRSKVPSANPKRKPLLGELVDVRRRLILAEEKARTARDFTNADDLETLRGVAREIARGASELLATLEAGTGAGLRAVQGA